MSLNVVLMPAQLPEVVEAFRFPSGIYDGTIVTPGDSLINVTLEAARAQMAGPSQFYWDLPRRGGLALMTRSEINNGRLALDLNTGAVT
jgi:hypothetical protein